MAKRFTDTEKWKKPFIRTLKAPYKLLWLYICDDCDHTGIWQIDIEVAEIRIGEKLDLNKAILYFNDKIIPLDNGTKWFIPSFIEFQYPSGLSDSNKAHTAIIKNLDKYKDEITNFKPLNSPLQGDKDMVMDKVMDKVKDKVMVIMPFDSEIFINYWDLWKDYKKKQLKFTFATPQSEQAALKDLVKLSKGDENTALQIIEQSMAKGWKGLFEIKTNNNGINQTQSRTCPKVTDEQLHQSFIKRANDWHNGGGI
jgi:hypothetical protein